MSNSLPVTLRAASIAKAHTVLACAAFLSALFIGCLLHYEKIVKNGVAGYPQEWFPSVSATIGDWYPERSVFQILIALTSGPRFALVYLQYQHQSQWSRTSFWPRILFLIGLIRTFSCGGWVYITSTDDHDAHDVFMILYMVCNLPWMIGGVLYSRKRVIWRRRAWVAAAFFVFIVPLVYFFIQHKVNRIPGAYTRYAFFEWGLIFFDVLYDSIAERDFTEADFKIIIGPSSEITTQIKCDILSNEEVAAQETNVKINVDEQTKKTQSNLGSSIKRRHPTRLILPAATLRSQLSFVSDVYLSFVFLTLFTALIPMLFYFSIWELGIAGQEFALSAVLSPFLLGFSSFNDFSQSKRGQIILQSSSLVGLAAYAFDKPLHRLLAVTPAAALGTLAATVKWIGDEPCYQAFVFGLGWVVTSFVRIMNHTNNPLWPFINGKSGGLNKTGISLAILATFELSTRKSTAFRLAALPVTPNHRSWLSPALALGSLIFTVHNLLADSSTLIAWSWTGYEDGLPRGPVPHLHCGLTIIVQCLGLALGLYACTESYQITVPESGPSQTRIKNSRFIEQSVTNHIRALITHPSFYAFGATSTYVLYMYENWTGYAGGLGVGFFMMSITPFVFEQVAATRIYAGRMLGTAFVVYCLLNLASIFTVAYAFVPGGIYFRERTNWVLFAQVVLFFPFFASTSNDKLSAPVSRTKASYVYIFLVLMTVFSGLVTLFRFPPSSPQPFKPGPRIIQAGIWTVHFGFDNEGHDSQRGIRNLVRDMQLDIVGLLETDLHRTSFGHRDLTRVAVENLGYNVDIGPSPNRHTWGCALLSKFPIIRSTHHLLPSPHGELAPAIEAVLDIYGTQVTVVVAHNGQEEDPLDRELQSTELARIMAASYPKPVIFLGYVVTKPLAKRPNPYEIMVTDGRVHDIDQDDLDRWCEYIFYRGLYRTSYARISRGIITDTEMQIGQFVLPRHGTPIVDESISARYSRAFKEQMPIEYWFPMAYYGGPGHGGVSGHYYHVFDTPLYYLLPLNATV